MSIFGHLGTNSGSRRRNCFFAVQQAIDWYGEKTL
jgi:hypothetical protein